MCLDRIMFMVAGAMVLLSVVLTVFVSPHFMWLTVFVGANLFQSSITGICPAAMIFKMLGAKQGKAF